MCRRDRPRVDAPGLPSAALRAGPRPALLGGRRGVGRPVGHPSAALRAGSGPTRRAAFPPLPFRRFGVSVFGRLGISLDPRSSPLDPTCAILSRSNSPEPPRYAPCPRLSLCSRCPLWSPPSPPTKTAKTMSHKSGALGGLRLAAPDGRFYRDVLLKTANGMLQACNPPPVRRGHNNMLGVPWRSLTPWRLPFPRQRKSSARM